MLVPFDLNVAVLVDALPCKTNPQLGYVDEVRVPVVLLGRSPAEDGADRGVDFCPLVDFPLESPLFFWLADADGFGPSLRPDCLPLLRLVSATSA